LWIVNLAINHQISQLPDYWIHLTTTVIAYDVAVIGAGPAGAWTAYLLAQRGARVAVIDGSHPREKPCGGGVTARALSLIGGALDAPLPAVAIRQARFVDSARREAAAVPLTARFEPSLIVASRASMDAQLLAAAVRAGARLVAARVTAIVRDGSSWELRSAEGHVRAGAIVGADGANSLTRRSLLRPFRRDQLSIAAGFFAHGATGCDILIEFTADPPGYIWSFPRPDHLAIGMCAEASAATSAQIRARTARWIATAGIARHSALRPYSWPIPSLSEREFQRLEVGGPGWLLVGDAAGLVDPITREGIYFALQSASFAAEALAQPRERTETAYADRIAGEIGSELARAARFKATFFRPRFIGVMLEALRGSARVRRIMADLVAGTQGYRDLKWRLVRTCELGLAVKAFSAISGRSNRPGLAPVHPDG
jgi:geranylgeranyl reductase family protein